MGKENSNLNLYFLYFLDLDINTYAKVQITSGCNPWAVSKTTRSMFFECWYVCIDVEIWEKGKFTGQGAVVRPKAEMLCPFEKSAARQAVIVIFLKVLGMFIRFVTP